MPAPRKPGRPPLDEHDPSDVIHVRMPTKQIDRLHTLARRHRLSVPDTVRRIVRAALVKIDGKP